jgi:hypothetical protein
MHQMMLLLLLLHYCMYKCSATEQQPTKPTCPGVDCSRASSTYTTFTGDARKALPSVQQEDQQANLTTIREWL